MIVCPHCEFENPALNRFCQRCGNPLKGLRAIITCSNGSTATIKGKDDLSASAMEGAGSEPLSLVSAQSLQAEATLADLLKTENYLDGEKRYQLRYPAENGQPLSEELELDIIDCQPAAASPVMLMAEGEADAHDDEVSPAQFLPPLAYPYWKLQDQFFPAVPELQAAWQEDAFTVLVLEDRSTWRQLSDVWNSEAAEPLELIHWFYEMVDLWDSLVSFEAEPSLLDHQNLLIDDDQILCLKRLLYRPSDRTYEVKDLGLLWQSLLQRSSDRRFASLEQLAIAIGAGEVIEVEAIKEQLSAIADKLQSETVAEAQANPKEVAPTDDRAKEGPEVASAKAPADEAEADKAVLLDDLLLDDLLEEGDIEESESGDETFGDMPTMTLPMQLYQLDEAGSTHVGRQRTHNEDSFYAETDLCRVDSPEGPSLKAKGLYILCDGMGGHAGGEVASTLAVNTLRNYFATHWQTDLPDEETIKAGILQANQAIFAMNESEARSGSARMGTTLVMLLFSDYQAIVAHVGDSRLYSFSRQGLKQVTVDHEVGQREISRGVEPAIAYARPDAYQLTQALGPRDNDEVLPNIAPLYVNQDTLFLLCSDGLSDNDVVEDYAETHVEPLLRSQANLEEGIAQLIDLANEHNGHDNITAIAIRVKMRPNLEALKNDDEESTDEEST